MLTTHMGKFWWKLSFQNNHVAGIKAGNLGSNPGPGKNFSLKLLMYDLPDGYSES